MISFKRQKEFLSVSFLVGGIKYSPADKVFGLRCRRDGGLTILDLCNDNPSSFCILLYSCISCVVRLWCEFVPGCGTASLPRSTAPLLGVLLVVLVNGEVTSWKKCILFREEERNDVLNYFRTPLPLNIYKLHLRRFGAFT